jgi:hypothetical protein
VGGAAGPRLDDLIWARPVHTGVAAGAAEGAAEVDGQGPAEISQPAHRLQVTRLLLPVPEAAVPWAGVSVFCGYTAAVLIAAAIAINHRDA